MKVISLSGVGVRFTIALVLVVLTWNPSALNYYDWARDNYSELTPLVFFVGLVLLVGWVVFLRATARSLGSVGIVLAFALAGAVLWLILDYGLVDPSNRTVVTWVVLILLSAILGAGMSWSHLRRRWSGQADVDDVEE